jgi:zinc transport system ATP-binding protein
MVQLKCENLTIGYDKKIILSNLSFEINKGDYLCIVGENGSGKSTLMKTILGLIPSIKGEIKFCDNLTNKDIGYLPQQSVVQRDFPASCMEIVMSGFQNKSKFRPFYKKEEKNKAREILSKLGILNLENKCYRELSGGQQQRVLLSRALCSTQKMLLLDEPVASLDPLASKDLYDVIKSLNNEGITIIMISHDILSSINYASHVLFVGKNTFFGTKKDFLSSDIGKKFIKFSNTQAGGDNNE